ncbi:MAG: LamG domain-containing protein, partial [Victivallales bacterium]|nr:LamG domain-containing protein [Victivallales bacterium]
MPNRHILAFACCLFAVSVTAEPTSTGLAFDGSQPWAVPGKAVGLSRTTFSFAAWVRIAGNREKQVFLNRGLPGTLTTFYIFKDKVRMLVENAPGSYTHATADLPTPKVWTHYAGTYDGKVIRIYRNGKLAATTKAPGQVSKSNADLHIGSQNDFERFLIGSLADIRVWNRTLTAKDVTAAMAGETGGELDRDLLARWTKDSLKKDQLVSLSPGTLVARKISKGSRLINKKADGFRGIWYYNQRLKNKYVYKYSGGLGTYCAKHIPMAWYAA